MCACHQFGYFRIPSASSIQHLVPETRYASSKISSSRPISGRNWKDHQDQQVARWGSKGPRGQMTTSSNLLMNYIGSFFSLNSLPPPLASYGHWEVISHYWPHERGGGKRGRGRGGGIWIQDAPDDGTPKNPRTSTSGGFLPLRTWENVQN